MCKEILNSEYETMSHSDLISEILKQKRIVNKLKGETTTLEDVMVSVRGNMSKAATLLNSSRVTIKRCIEHKTVNRVAVFDCGSMLLLTPTKGSGAGSK